MLGLGPTELLLILAVVMIIFGAGKLPQVLGSMGKGVKEFREASEGRAEAVVVTEPQVIEKPSANR
jgi:sec-independent protein translocase protein TatA